LRQIISHGYALHACGELCNAGWLRIWHTLAKTLLREQSAQSYFEHRANGANGATGATGANGGGAGSTGDGQEQPGSWT
jgi:hypothetical protein